MKACAFLSAAPLFLSIFFCQASASPDELLAAVGPLPSHRQGQSISPQEHNPFSTKAKTVSPQAKGPEEDTQESKIRKIFGALGVNGVRMADAGRSMALVGDIILREGDTVVPVLADQTETLKVSRITPDRVELVFVETKEATQPRTITLKVDQKPQVAQLLSGQSKARQMYVRNHTRAAQAGQAAAEALAQPIAPSTELPEPITAPEAITTAPSTPAATAVSSAPAASPAPASSSAE